MALSFTQPYYLKCLRNGLVEATVYLEYVSDEPLDRILLDTLFPRADQG